MIILYLNHKIVNCGVYQYGKRLHEILKLHDKIKFIYREIDSYTEYQNAINEITDLYAIIYNYHNSTMTWLNGSNIQRIVKNIGIPHESAEHLFDIICNIDPNAPESANRFSLPRPIYENVDEMLANYSSSNEEIKKFIGAYTETEIPIFGSFGFGFANKGFDKIVSVINQQYEKAIIKFIIPKAHFDPNPHTTTEIVNKIININKKPGIQLMFYHDFVSTEDILSFLKSNTMNIFLYDTMHGRGISSTIDYAISVKKPLGISDSYMFRNIYVDDICLYKTSIKDCLNTSISYCNKFIVDYSHQKVRDKFNCILQI
jgi:hypothetical protein